MSDGAGNRIPKTLADVSHLFFSNPEGQNEGATPRREGAERRPGGRGSSLGAVRADERERWRRTRVALVTGGAGAPGKSTVAVNLATALAQRGSVALFDADPKLPNARFYLGLPSWHYLSPVAGDGTPAPITVTESGLVVADWSSGDAVADWLKGGDLIYVDVEAAGRCGLDYAVIDAPVSRIAWMAEFAHRVDSFVVVARPGRSGFEETFGALALLARRAGVRRAAVVVNMVPDRDYAAAFHAKLLAAAERLLCTDVSLLGGLMYQAGLGAEQREHGAIVRSRPGAAAALVLREMAAKAFTGERANDPLPEEPIPTVNEEVSHECEARENSAS